MIATKLFTVLAILLLVAPIAAFAAEDSKASEFTIDHIDYEDNVAPGTSIPVEMTLANSDPTLNIENIEVKAWLENKFGERVSDKAVASGLIVQQNSDRDLKLTLEVPADVAAGDYTIVIQASGRFESPFSVAGEKVTVEARKTLEVEGMDDSVYVADVRLSKTQYKAGDTVDVAVTVMNNGKDDLANVAIAIAVPEFDVLKSAKLFGDLYSGTEQTVYFTFNLPKDASGIYTLKATASNDLAKNTANINLVVEVPAKVDTAKTPTSTITKDLKFGQTGVLQLNIANKGTETKTYAVAVVSDNIKATVTPATFSLAPAQSRTVSVEMTPEVTGAQTATITVTENGNAISQMTVNADVTQGLSGLAGLFVGLAIIGAAIVAFMQYNKNGNGKTAKTLYY
jgi:hypothetical protein